MARLKPISFRAVLLNGKYITVLGKYFDCSFVPGHLICRYYVAWPPEVELLLLNMIFISDQHHMQCCAAPLPSPQPFWFCCDCIMQLSFSDNSKFSLDYVALLGSSQLKNIIGTLDAQWNIAPNISFNWKIVKITDEERYGYESLTDEIICHLEPVFLVLRVSECIVWELQVTK